MPMREISEDVQAAQGLGCKMEVVEAAPSLSGDFCKA